MRNLLPHEKLRRLLAETVPRLVLSTKGLDLKTWRRRPAPGEWSVTEVICHLYDVELEVHLPRLNSLITEQEPFMPGIVSDDWASERNYQEQDGSLMLEKLGQARSELLALIPPAGDPTWDRYGRHTFFGPTTFWELVCLIVEHDELHINQVTTTIRYEDEA